LLRDEFSPWIGWKRAIPDRARKILITIGGSDPDNASEQILQSLALLKSSPEDSPETRKRFWWSEAATRICHLCRRPSTFVQFRCA